MDIRIGGRLGPDPRFGEVVAKNVPHWQLNAKLLEILDLYERHHHEAETFRQFAARSTPEWWEHQLADPGPAPVAA